MRAVVIEKPGSVSVVATEDPAPGPRDVVVEVAACGVCGTDLHILDGEFAPTPYPLVPGHEFAGTVVAVGADVAELREGDRVACDPSLFCGECAYCNAGRGNLCERWNAIGVTGNGACAEYVAVPARNCYPLPAAMALGHAALIEPLSCAVRGFDLLPRRLGEHYLVYGAGTMGLMMLQLARGAGASSVTVVELNEERRSVARGIGADSAGASADEFERPHGWDVVIDCTGAVAAIEDGLTRVRRGGTFQQFGVAPADATARFSPFRVYNDEITIVGSMAVLHSFGRAVELLGQGAIDADTMITHTLPLDEYEQAIELFRSGAGKKLQLAPGAARS